MNLAKLIPAPWTALEIAKEVDAVKAEIVKRASPKIIYLFGSALQGAPRASSDLDFAVIVDTVNEVKTAQRAIFAYPPMSSMPVDILIFDAASFRVKSDRGGICQVILDEGKIIYSR